jgi:uncharacterized membrane protein
LFGLSRTAGKKMEAEKKPDQETYDKWHSDPENWKLGVFYFNKKDKRMFPPKRIGWMGWTINFANPVSYLGLLGLIIVIIIVERYLK